MFVENIENDEDTKSAILNNARQEGYDSVVFLDFDDSMGNDLLSNVVAVFDPGKIFVVHDDAETSNFQSESIDGLDYVKHDLGYEWNKDKHREIFSEITRTLDGILTQPGIQYDLDFGDQSTNGST